MPNLPWSKPKERSELLIITGMSGAGRTRSATVLEDHDWFVVDNLPPQMLIPLSRLVIQTRGELQRLAVVVDVRGREFFEDLVDAMKGLDKAGVDCRILFLDASDEELIRRFEQVRRPHPLQGDGRLVDGIAEERRLLEDLRSRADVVIDSTGLNVHELANAVTDAIVGDEATPLRLTVMSFGFKHGIPLDADHVVDVRFLDNPHWIEELRPLTGLDQPVSDHVLSDPGAKTFLERYESALAPVFEGYGRENKRFVTIAVGCTGGRHRSVAIAEQLAKDLASERVSVRTVHRDVGRD